MNATTALLQIIRQRAIDRFPMDLQGIHGLKHWERVRENAEYLCSYNGGDVFVAQLFAYLHDCCRESDGADPEHGLRAAEYAEYLWEGKVLTISEPQLHQLTTACELHERGRLSEDPTIAACWDADRLDLGRVAVRPNVKYLSSERAQRSAVIAWAYTRSRGHRASKPH